MSFKSVPICEILFDSEGLVPFKDTDPYQLGKCAQALLNTILIENLGKVKPQSSPSFLHCNPHALHCISFEILNPNSMSPQSSHYHYYSWNKIQRDN